MLVKNRKRKTCVQLADGAHFIKFHTKLTEFVQHIRFWSLSSADADYIHLATTWTNECSSHPTQTKIYMQKLIGFTWVCLSAREKQNMANSPRNLLLIIRAFGEEKKRKQKPELINVINFECAIWLNAAQSSKSPVSHPKRGRKPIAFIITMIKRQSHAHTHCVAF